jgi:hypothetical protein
MGAPKARSMESGLRVPPALSRSTARNRSTGSEPGAPYLGGDLGGLNMEPWSCEHCARMAKDGCGSRALLRLFANIRRWIDRGSSARQARRSEAAAPIFLHERQAEATIKAYFYNPTGEKARAVKARYRGVCRGGGANTQPRNGKGDVYAYCERCHPARSSKLDVRARARVDARVALPLRLVTVLV